MFRRIFESIGDIMTKYENGKRVCARGITFINNKIILIERHRKINDEILHYFTIPGGGVEDNESYEEAAVRETYEETTVETKAIKYLKKEDYGEGIVYWYFLEYISGTPTLGGEELERNSLNNHYQVVLVSIDEIDNLNILGEGKTLIKNTYEEYKKVKENL